MHSQRMSCNPPLSPNRVATALVAMVILLSGLQRNSMAQDRISTSSPLSVNDVVDNLIRRNAERARNLQHSEATRIYQLTYRGFPGDREAEMTVEALYDSPATKEFKVLSQSGSKLIVDRVFKKLLESEQESVRPEINSQTRLDRGNYEFALDSYEPAQDRYVLRVTPKRKAKFVYRGKIWVDGKDFAVAKIEAEPAQNPSFWTKKSEIHHEYQKIQGFWVPAKNESISYIRLGGRATLTIEYKDYQLIPASAEPAVASQSALGISPAPESSH
jgi:hypothetical protein